MIVGSVKWLLHSSANVRRLEESLKLDESMYLISTSIVKHGLLGILAKLYWRKLVKRHMK